MKEEVSDIRWISVEESNAWREYRLVFYSPNVFDGSGCNHAGGTLLQGEEISVGNWMMLLWKASSW
jgi:hypothetical protein